jgi:hypothetical protein
MRLMCNLLAGALLLSLTVPTEAAPQNPKGKKGGHVNGVVTAVQKDNDKDTGTITVKIHHKKKGQPAGAAEVVEKTFKVTSASKFEKVSGPKGQRQTQPATFADVKQGEHVQIHTKSGAADVAANVAIVSGKKK